MPAFLKTLLYPTLSLTILLLVGCSRDNPLSVPSEYVETEIDCTPTLPNLALLTNIEVTNTELSYQFNEVIDNVELSRIGYGFLPDVLNYDAEADHLINSVVTTATPMNIDLFNLELGADGTKTEGIKGITSIEIKVDGTMIDSENINSTRELTEEQITIKVAVLAKFDVYVNATNQQGICSAVFTEDSTGELTTVQETVKKSQVSNYIIILTRLEFNELTTLPLELTSAISAENDEFGRSISLGVMAESNDTDPAIIGAAIGVPNTDIDNQDNVEDNKEDTGSVYIYAQQDKNDWLELISLNAAKPDTGDLFGYSVALSNGYLAVSAPGEDSFNAGIYPWEDANGDNINDNLDIEISNLAESSGAVYLFKRMLSDPNGWRQTVFIKQPEIQPGRANYDIGFGKKVLLKDNLLLIAAPQQQVTTQTDETATVTNSGVVYVYRYIKDPDPESGPEDKIWSFSTTLISETPGMNDGFGSALAIHDGFILVGAPGENNGSGGAYLFSTKGNIWELSTHLTASNSDLGDAYGTSVAMSSTKIFIGANKEDSYGKSLNRNKDDNSLNNSGAVYGYSKNDPAEPWVEFVYVKADTPMEGAQFGYALKFDSGNLIIGEPFRSNDNSIGQVYLYGLYDKALQPSKIITYDTLESSISSANSQLNARFGSSIALFERIFAAGANGFTNRETGISKTNSGKAYIFQ